MHFSRQLNCWSLRFSWSIACRRCSNYIFILNLTPGFNRLGKDNYKMRREAFQFSDLVRLILETLRYSISCCTGLCYNSTWMYWGKVTQLGTHSTSLQILCIEWWLGIVGSLAEFIMPNVEKKSWPFEVHFLYKMYSVLWLYRWLSARLQ